MGERPANFGFENAPISGAAPSPPASHLQVVRLPLQLGSNAPAVNFTGDQAETHNRHDHTGVQLTSQSNGSWHEQERLVTLHGDPDCCRETRVGVCRLTRHAKWPGLDKVFGRLAGISATHQSGIETSTEHRSPPGFYRIAAVRSPRRCSSF